MSGVRVGIGDAAVAVFVVAAYGIARQSRTAHRW